MFLVARVAPIARQIPGRLAPVGMVMDGFQPDRYDVGGALICLVGVAVIMCSPLGR